MSHSKKLSDALGLGKFQEYPQNYDATLLQPIPRELNRAELPIKAFEGCDVWTAYELSWLDVTGKPCVAIAEFTIPASTPNIVESKSFKYYLNSFNQERIEREILVSRLQSDLSQAAGGEITIQLYELNSYSYPPLAIAHHVCVDDCALQAPVYTPASEILLRAKEAGKSNGNNTPLQTQHYVSHLLKSNCPVTGQPDWASVWISIEGAELAPEDFLAYIVSYRDHQDFHENCVEKIYCDITTQLKPTSLWVYARYTRRGGLDINPFRASSNKQELPWVRGARQ